MKHVELEIAERVLGNGLTAIAVRNPGVTTFACRVVLPVGQVAEAPDEHGLANLVGACLEEGTRGRSAVELAEAVENLGGSLATYANGGLIECPAEEAGRSIRLLRDVITEPAFPAREIRRVQQEIAAEIEADEADPRVVALRRFRASVYGEHPYGRPAAGEKERIPEFRPADLRRFHRKWFVPERAYVAVSGPGPVAEGLDLCAKAFRGFRGRSPVRIEPTAPPSPTRARDEHVPMDREQVHVYLGHRGIRLVDPDYHALSVMDHVLGTGPGFTSRIARRLRDEQGLCYSVHASIAASAGAQPGTFSCYIGTSPRHRKKAIAEFLREMRRIRESLPGADEVGDVQRYLTGSFVFGLERNANLVRYAIRANRFGLGYDYAQRFEDLIRAVTLEDVRRVARTHLDPDHVAIVSAGASVRSTR